MTSAVTPTTGAGDAQTPPATGTGGAAGSGRPGRIPLNTFAIGFGLAGLAEVWSKATPALRLPGAVAQVFWVIAGIAWCWLLVAHLVRGHRSGLPLSGQLHHPAQGSLIALAPVTLMLLAGDVFGFLPTCGRIMFVVAVVASTLFAAWRLANWFEGHLDFEAMHPGYLLPTVAPGLVGGDVAYVVGFHHLAWGLFGVGACFTIIMTAILVLRLAVHAPLPAPLLPTTAILLAPPPVAGLAWFAFNGGRIDAFAEAVAGVGVLLLLVQVAMLPRYRRLSFSLGFWSFTFPFAAAVAWTIEWLEIAGTAGRQLITGVLATAMTLFIGAIAVESLRLTAGRGRGRGPAAGAPR